VRVSPLWLGSSLCSPGAASRAQLTDRRSRRPSDPQAGSERYRPSVHIEHPARLVVVLAIAIGASMPTVAAATSASKPAGSAVSSTTLTFVDAARQRTLATTVYSSRHAAGPAPLVVFVHGYDQSPADYRNLLKAWASAGYIVAAPTFPSTNRDAASLDASDYTHEPMDVSFVISQIVTQSAAPTGPLSGRVDPTRIGVAGHSLGAEVVLGLLNRCCRDPRVQAAISLAGSEQFNPGEPAFPLDGYFVGPPIPLLLVHGDADRENPYERSVTAFGGAPPPKFFVTIHGGDHRLPYQDSLRHPRAHAVSMITVDFLDTYLKRQPAALSRLEHDGTVPNVATLLTALS
jgi:poly(3-hydroxybutyrate) depolymerase